MNDFVTWAGIGSYAGSVTITAIITQFLKQLPGVGKMNSQLLSFIVAVLILEAHAAFIGGWHFDTAVINLVNAVVVALAANGTYDVFHTNKTAQKTITTGEKKEDVING